MARRKKTDRQTSGAYSQAGGRVETRLTPQPPWYGGTFFLALTSGLALWAAFPPINCWPLAWAASFAWLVLIARQRISGRRPYLSIWAAASVYWLLMLQGIRLAHPALYLGWIALSLYLAVYIVLFIGLSRVAVHRLGCSIVVAAPLVWTGLEYFRAHFLSGFAMGLLGHSQLPWTAVIQVADLGGGYAVGSIMTFVTACVVRATPWGTPAPRPDPDNTAAARPDKESQQPAGRVRSQRRRWTLWPPITAICVLLLTLGYGRARLATSPNQQDPQPALQAALIQGSFDTFYEYDPKVNAEYFARYLELSEQAVTRHPEVDLVVWPESMFAGDLGDLITGGEIAPPPDSGATRAELEEFVSQWKLAQQEKYRDVSHRLNRHSESGHVYLIGGTDTQRIHGNIVDQHNSAICLAPSGEVIGRYYKMHLVVFGEYLPLGNTFPWLYDLTPMPRGLTPGRQPESFHVSGTTVIPSICFESTVPHLIRRQLRQLERGQDEPTVLVNVTNDGWFHGSSMLDLHLACAAFRSVELHRPMLIAANTGISAYVNSDGRIVCRGSAGSEDVLHACVIADKRTSPYRLIGDTWPFVCLMLCLGLAIIGLALRRQAYNPDKTAE